MSSNYNGPDEATADVIRDEVTKGMPPTRTREHYQGVLDAEVAKRAIKGEAPGATLGRVSSDPFIAGLYDAILKAAPAPTPDASPAPPANQRARYEETLQKAAENRAAASNGRETVAAAYAAILKEQPELYESILRASGD